MTYITKIEPIAVVTKAEFEKFLNSNSLVCERIPMVFTMSDNETRIRYASLRDYKSHLLQIELISQGANPKTLGDLIEIEREDAYDQGQYDAEVAAY